MIEPNNRVHFFANAEYWMVTPLDILGRTWQGSAEVLNLFDIHLECHLFLVDGRPFLRIGLGGCLRMGFGVILAYELTPGVSGNVQAGFELVGFWKHFVMKG